jgi:hypothetical protein
MSLSARMSIFSIDFLHSVNRKIRSLLPIALAMVVCGLALRFFYLTFYKYSPPDIWNMDFFSIWSFAKFAFVNRVSEIYDNSRLLDLQMDLGAVPTERPYPYPPSFLLMILPLGVLSFPLAFTTWNIFTFSIYFAASFYRRWRISAILLIIFSPAALQNFCTGQTGFLSAGLILGGFRLMETRAILSGTLFGLASFKPTLGILIPIALISARAWRALVAAVVTIAVLVVASSLVFGWSIWPIWLAKLPAHADWAAAVPDKFKPTITANLTFLGVRPAIVQVAQISVAGLVALVIWACFRRGVTLLATAALLVGTVLATPYAFLYDLPIVTNAVLMFIRHKDQTNRFLTIPETAILLLSLVVPMLTLETWRPAMLRSVPFLLLFGIILRDLFRFHSDVEEPKSAPVRSTAGKLSQ